MVRGSGERAALQHLCSLDNLDCQSSSYDWLFSVRKCGNRRRAMCKQVFFRSQTRGMLSGDVRALSIAGRVKALGRSSKDDGRIVVPAVRREASVDRARSSSESIIWGKKIHSLDSEKE